MMGGKCSARTAAGKCLPGGTLIFDTTDRIADITAVATGRTPLTGTRCFKRTGRTLYVTSTSSCSSSTTSYDLEVVPDPTLNSDGTYRYEPTGIIQQVGAKARFGLMEFKGSGDGGRVLADVGSTPLVNNSTCSGSNLPIVNAIECTAATTWTPLAESLYEATRYFAQIAPAYSTSDYSYTTQSRDPFYFTSPTWSTTAQYVTCCKSFVILFTDGQPTQDLVIPDSIKGYASEFYPTPLIALRRPVARVTIARAAITTALSRITSIIAQSITAAPPAIHACRTDRTI